MLKFIFALIIIIISLVQSSVIPQQEHKTRILNKSFGDGEHFSDETHNKDVDHEAFLGKDESKSYDQLPPEESRARLGALYEKIDKDQDGQLTEDELTEWIQYVQARYVRVDTDRQWSNYKIAENGSLSWDTYKDRTYGHIKEDENEDENENKGYSYRNMMKRDSRRWSKADQNNDMILTKQEFTDFLHPEESKHMKDIIVDETIEDMDKNKDGLLSLAEYLSDMWPGLNKDDDEEPDWLKTEKEQFHTYRDKNKDGMMDRNEVMDWIIPPDYDHTRAEAKHLIYNSDINKDEMLTKQEVLDKYDLFVGSQATDFGDAILKHDEF